MIELTVMRYVFTSKEVTYALQSDYVFCMLLRFSMKKRFTL